MFSLTSIMLLCHIFLNQRINISTAFVLIGDLYFKISDEREISTLNTIRVNKVKVILVLTLITLPISPS